jgi:hypothetical protein
MTTKGEVLQAIRGKCLDCSNFQPVEVLKCTVTKCPLFIFRMGKDPCPNPNNVLKGKNIKPVVPTNTAETK